MAKKSLINSAAPYIQFLDSIRLSGSVKNKYHYANIVKQNSFFKNFLDSFSIGICISDFQTQQYVYVSEKTIEKLTGYPAEEFMKKGIPFFISHVHPADAKAIACHFNPILMTSLNKYTKEQIRQCSFSYTYRFKRKDNKWVKFLQNFIILEMDEKKLPLLALTIISNITPYKKDNDVVFNFSHHEHECESINTTIRQLKAFVITTERENEIIRYIAKGIKTKEIAAIMHLSIHTVRAHKGNIFIKTKTSNIAELTSYAFANGIL